MNASINVEGIASKVLMSCTKKIGVGVYMYP